MAYQLIEKEEKVTIKENAYRVITIGVKGLIEMKILTLGCMTSSLQVLDNNKMTDMILKYPNIDDYYHDPHFLGGHVGFVNDHIYPPQVIAGGQTIPLRTYNGNRFSLHQEPDNVMRMKYEFRGFEKHDDRITANFGIEVPDGFDGLPGNRTHEIKIIIAAGDPGSVSWEDKFTSDKPSPSCRTRHEFWTLGVPRVQELMYYINADSIIQTEDDGVATGEVIPVNTAAGYDFTTLTKIGVNIEAGGLKGYDTPYILRRSRNVNEPAAILRSSSMGMEVVSALKFLKTYSGFGFDGSAPGWFEHSSGLTIQPCQAPPNASNYPEDSQFEKDIGYVSHDQKVTHIFKKVA